MSAIGYAFREALVTLRRSGRSAAMSIGTIAIAFVTLGGFLFLSANLQSVIERWAAAAEMSVYVEAALNDSAREALSAELGAHPAVASVEYVSAPQALERFTADFPELADVAASGENPFPPSLEVRLRSDAASTTAAAGIADQIAARDGVVDVRYDRQWLSRLMALVSGFRIAGFVVAAILVVGAAFTVSAVVRLSMHVRREELDIMQLVGAPLSFIRGPSVAEGTLLGGIGAALALVVLYVMFVSTRAPLNSVVSAWGSVGELRFLSLADSTWLVAAGVIVGAVSGLVVSRAGRD